MGEQRLNFRCFGMFRVTTESGLDVTPSSQKSQALLAILLTSQDFARPRVKLQDLLWSDREPEQGAASLRQELSSLKRSLGPHADILHADRTVIRLDGSRLESDCDARGPKPGAGPEQQEFLEGIGVRDPEFSDWLRDRRAEYQDAQPAAPSQMVSADRPALFLSISEGSGAVSRHVANAISAGVLDWTAIDLRQGTPDVTSDGMFQIEAGDLRLGDDVFVQVALKNLRNNRIEWSSTLELNVDPSAGVQANLSRVINEGIQRTLDTLFADRGRFTASNPNAAIQTIEYMFRNFGDSYERIAQVFQDEYEATGQGVYLAWRAFLSTYAIGGRRARDLQELREETGELVRRALLAEPHNALSLALCAHASAFTLGDHETAFELADRSVRLQSNNPLGWLFRGVALLNLGRLEEGRESILHAQKTSGEAPYRYLIDCYTCIAEMLSGDFMNAIGSGKTALAYAPEFTPTLRYLLVNYLSLGDYEAARKAVERLRKLEPDFDVRMLSEPDYPTPLMRKYEILDLSKLPKLLSP
ncbi:hypothetical protein HKCCSP123_13890 [Rhodobacterales bacterium HKCCSP123]|nr:hypothetical protein [Rhodobacterales bacterium HKCCSP123]